ncbi:MAG: FAD-dependent oxidoreductase, partial [Patescibacteria group bacterium]|nr:FAD-dependent oxidoreductase [Patescibacteria group bacterium]
YGIPGADRFTFPLKTLQEATIVRSRVIDAFESAIRSNEPAERRKKLTFAVVGGGATGVEVAAELVEFIRGMVKRYYYNTNCLPGEAGQCRPEEVSISLVHTGKELLEMFAPSLRRAAASRLVRHGVNLRLSCTVGEVTADGLKLKDGGIVQASTVIWAAGVKAVIPAFEGAPPAMSGGRLIVDQYFRLQGSDRIFALGDAAGYVDAHEFIKDSKNTRAVPMLAQVAVQEAKIVADNIVASIRRRPLANFHYHSKGSMVSIGQWFAIGEIYSLNIAGRLTWWVWRTVYLFKFASWQKRLRIAIDWTLDFFYPRDITKLS